MAALSQVFQERDKDKLRDEALSSDRVAAASTLRLKGYKDMLDNYNGEILRLEQAPSGKDATIATL
jgi:hypothetical protein